MNKPKNTPDQSDLLDLVNDVAASLALSTVVTDAAGAAVIHVDGSTTNQLVITITNQTSGAITISKLTGIASASNYNVLFKLPNNELYFYDAPTIDASSAPGTWELATDSASGGAGWVDSIYLANTGTCVLTPLGQTGDSVSIIINYSEVVPDDPKALNIPVQVSYQNMTNSSGTALKGTSPAQTMGIMANAGWPSPLLGSIVGPATVLNDGTTAHALTLRMVNTSLDPLQFIVPVSGQPTQSYIEVVLPVSDTASDALWALCNTTSWNAINVALAGSDSAGWTVAKSTTTPGVITLTPDFSKVTNIPAGGEIDLQLTNVISGLEPGMTQARVTLERFALIGTQSFGVTIEKSPLIYNAGLGNGMQLASGSLGANCALGITGDSTGNLMQITQSGSGQALQVNGGDAEFSNAVKSASANIIGALTADSIAASSAAVSGNLTAGTAAVSGGISAASAAISGALSADSTKISKSARIDGPSASTQDPSLSLGGHGNFNVDSDGTSGGRFTVLDNGSVGINNNAPSATLHVNGSTILNGTVQAMGSTPQAIGSGTFTAPTDGFVMATINNTGDYGKMSTTVMTVSSNGVSVYATGGNSCKFLTWGSTNTAYFGPLQSSCMLPVSKGSTFSVSVLNFTDNQISPTTNTFWTPIGLGNVGDTTPERIGEAPPISEEELNLRMVCGIGERPADIHDLDISDLTGVLNEILGDLMNDDQKVRLQDSIRRIVYWETIQNFEK